ncbi:hypothetical protein VOI32_40885 [Paraburkholderia caribensis]|uniref:20S proteasome A and B subunits n=2 Tax=Paraburkholderia TaxID=1822464 RepID=B2JY74_PARP8|nr:MULTISPECIES: hypothetical protein [Paraburkholderia]ACC76582.1 conserved hypothetical protein [Paraburkholderia phymatum STM815]MCO4880455.1 hypothetical protein [Paraburkholderia caribensis]PTB22962.1 hypothetical protein C9I56_41730 [Paraburkholderia caribensis]
MTCIVALTDGKKVYMGADSAGGSNDWSITVRADPKIYRVGPFLIGFTSSFRMGQLLGHSLTVASRPEGTDAFAFMCTTFIEAVRACFTRGGYTRKDGERESAGTFLVGYEGRIFRIGGDYQVGENAVNFNACGCGAQLALGSLHSTVGMPMLPEIKLERALAAAAEFSAGVRGPFRIEVLDGQTDQWSNEEKVCDL